MVPEGGNKVSAMGDRAAAALFGASDAGKRTEPILVLFADGMASVVPGAGLETVLEQEGTRSTWRVGE